MAANNRKLKLLYLDIGGNRFEAQLTNWQITNGTGDPDIHYTYAPDGAFAEAADDSYQLELHFYADWRSAGVSDYLWANDGNTVNFTIDHLPDIVGEHVRWTGQVQIKAPSVGGEVRTTELTETTLGIVGKPVYTRVG